MKEKCFFCEDKTSNYTHVGCFVKASENTRGEFTHIQILKQRAFLASGGGKQNTTGDKQYHIATNNLYKAQKELDKNG